VAAPGEQAAMIRSEKIIWIFFAATSCQLAFQHPSCLLVAGDRSNLFSGLLAFLTLIVAVVLFGTLRWKYFVLICLVMALVVGAFRQQILWFKLSTADTGSSRWMKNFPFSWGIAQKYPWFGIGRRAPRGNLSCAPKIPTG
jgi:hypothetical protein